jgi:hypothetical protein
MRNLLLMAFLLVPVIARGATKNEQPCKTQFTVAWTDRLNNVRQGLSEKEGKEVQKKLTKKYPELCYAEPSPSVTLVFFVSTSEAVYHGSRTTTSDSTHDEPVTGTITDQDGNVSNVSGTQTVTTTSTSTVPVQFDYPVFTLAIETRNADGKFTLLHTVQRKGLCPAYAGFCIANRHPDVGIVEDAVKWIHAGGLTDARQGVVQ